MLNLKKMIARANIQRQRHATQAHAEQPPLPLSIIEESVNKIPDEALHQEGAHGVSFGAEYCLVHSSKTSSNSKSFSNLHIQPLSPRHSSWPSTAGRVIVESNLFSKTTTVQKKYFTSASLSLSSRSTLLFSLKRFLRRL
eukprot:GILI01034442.1.p1 GENE.GILI01034442.1~~GILI01034442.1.p1  ORF type:complete len:164 (+),score=16.12 GILI01034442.1:75-494(+)